MLAQEVADFTHDCYGPSRAKLFMSRPTLSDEQMNDVTWIGSSCFLDTPGSTTPIAPDPRAAWPYDATRDAGLAQVDSGAAIRPAGSGGLMVTRTAQPAAGTGRPGPADPHRALGGLPVARRGQ